MILCGVVMARLGTWADFFRPFTLIPPLLGIISGAVCAFGSIHNPDPERSVTVPVLLTVALGSLCASLMNAASNGVNQIYDLEIDRINKPRRHLVTGRIGIGEAWKVSWVLYAMALIPTWLVVVHPYNTFLAKLFAPLEWHQCFFLYLAGLLFTFVYSAPALGRTKARGMWANWTIAIPRGCLLKVAGWSMVASIWATEPWYIGSIFMLFLVGAASTKDFSDIEGDRAGGCRTPPIIHGVRKSAWIISPFFIFPWVLISIGAVVRDPFARSVHPILTGNASILHALTIVLVAWGSYTVYLLLRDPDELAKVENHPSWRHMYMMLMTAQVGFAVAYIV